jgi:hypothetical protein
MVAEIGTIFQAKKKYVYDDKQGKQYYNLYCG